MKFKDENNQVHDPEMDEVEGLTLLKKVHPDMTFTPITDEEAALLTSPTPLTAQELDAEFNMQVDAELREIDLQSIRSLREYIASKPDAPQWLKDQEDAATVTRSTRRP